MGKQREHRRQQEQQLAGFMAESTAAQLPFNGVTKDDELVLEQGNGKAMHQPPPQGASSDDIVKILQHMQSDTHRIDQNVLNTGKAMNRVQNRIHEVQVNLQAVQGNVVQLHQRVGGLEMQVQGAAHAMGRLHLEQANQWKDMSKKEKKKVSKHYDRVLSARKSKLEKAIDKVGDHPLTKAAAIGGLGWLGWKAGKAAYGFLTGDAATAIDGITE